MKLTSRSYPYPVVGNRDDVPGAGFQAALEMSADKQLVYLDADVSCSSTSINSLIRRDEACFVLHVECGNTLFRHAFDFHNPKHRVSIPVDNLNDAVEVNVFVRAMRDSPSYRVDKAHADYGETVFDVGKGDILAVGEGQIFFIDSNFDSLS